jgi:hypothetical protein
MARRKRTDTGERLTVKRMVLFSPTTAATLDAAAKSAGVKFSHYARELLESRSAAVAARVVARRNPEIVALRRDIQAAIHAENANGNLLNQIARHLHMTGEMRDRQDLEEAIAIYKKTSDRLVAALDRVTEL